MKSLVPWLWAGAALLCIVVLWGDEAWIAWKFDKLCMDAGVHIVRPVQADGYIETFRGKGSISSDHAKGVLVTDPLRVADFDRDRGGYRFVESLFSDGKVWHVERVPEGVQMSVLEQPLAKYELKYSRYHEDAGYQLEAIERVVIDRASGEILGRDTSYGRYPGWFSGLLIRLLGSGLILCPDPEKGPRQPPFPEAVLVPSSVTIGR